MSNLYSQVVKKSDMTDITLNEFKNKVLLIVNVASECGLTYQYEALQDLHNKYNADGLEILGFPCNQFGAQEPGNDEEIIKFCKENYGVSFLLTEKIKVKGDGIHPLYKWLCTKEINGKSNSTVKWNFQKYLLDEKGEFVNYFFSITKPMSSKIIDYL